MTPEQQATYDAYQDMFGSQGWKLFSESITSYKTNLKDNAWSSVASLEDIGKVKGNLHALDMILGLEATMSKENLDEEMPEESLEE